MLLLLLSSPKCPGGQHGGQRGMLVSVKVGWLVDNNAITAVQVLPSLIGGGGELVFELW